MARKSERSWLSAIFGLIFLLAGLAAAYGSGGMMILGYFTSANWEEVPATIHTVELVSERGDSTTYSVKSSYSYEYNGRNYNSDRVSLSRGNDNIGRYWQDLARSLRADQSSNEAFALVNPNDPTDSLLDRTLRWKSLVFASVFLLLFGGVGGFIMWASLRSSKSRKERVQGEQKTGISVVERDAAQASDDLSIPQRFIETANEKAEDLAKTSVLVDVPVTQDGHNIIVHSRAGRNISFNMLGILFGALLTGVGIFIAMDDEWFGYLFMLFGGASLFFSLRSLGRSIRVTINKDSRVINTRVSWFGLRYASHEGDVHDPDQFELNQTSTSTTGNKVTRFYALEFASADKTIRIADGIEGKQEALALKEAIVERCF
ncbi:MAG: DUF3592 domain-containing protein [Granulosicoccaceae bacterium]